jgi:magnesium transporter
MAASPTGVTTVSVPAPTAAPAATPADTECKTRLVRADGTVKEDPSLADIDAAAGQQAPFWLDLTEVSAEVAAWLERKLGLHPLVIEDAQQFGERPKMEKFDGYLAVVLYGAGTGPSLDKLAEGTSPGPVNVTSLDDLGEVHCIVAERYIVTVHRGNCPAIEAATGRARTREAVSAGPAGVFYQVAEGLADSFFPVVEELDDRLDAIQAEIIRSPRPSQLAELAGYRSALSPLHKVLQPQADIFQVLSSGRVRVPGGGGDEQLPYLRDVHDHLQKLSDVVDSYRDTIGATANAYSSVVSNQQNVVMKQLAVISTIFLPLTFLTGFFGQNFGALVGHITSWEAFLIFGVGSELLAVALLYLVFRARGWLRN